MTAQPGKNSAETDEAAKDTTGSNGKVTGGSGGGAVTTSLKKAGDSKAGDGSGGTAGAKPVAKSGLKSTAGSSGDAAETKVDTPTLADSASSKPIDGVKPASGTIASSASSFSSSGSSSSASAASPSAGTDTGGSGSRPVMPPPAGSSSFGTTPAISTPYGPGPADAGSGASAASTSSMSSSASSASGGSVTGTAVRPQQTNQPTGKAAARKAHLQLARLEPWSVMKFSFVMSLVCFVVLLVAVVVLWVVLSGLGVFDAISTTVNDLTREQGDKTGGLDAGSWFSFARVFGYTVLVGAVNVLLITALSTIGSVMYNMAADLVGGVEVTLKEVE